jgi:hypothetical protein
MANYRVSTIANNSNKTTQNKTTTTKQRKVDQLRLSKLKHDLLKLIIIMVKTLFRAHFLFIFIIIPKSRN